MEQVHLKGHEGEHETSLGIPHRKLLIGVFLASECMFFGSLIATYLVYQNKSLVGPYPIDVFSIPITSVSTFVLLVSSMSMVLAYSAISRGNIKVFRIWSCFRGRQYWVKKRPCLQILEWTPSNESIMYTGVKNEEILKIREKSIC